MSILFLILFVILLLLLYFISPSEYNFYFCSILIIIDIISLCLLFIRYKKKSYDGNIIAIPSVLFLLSFIIVNFQCFIDLMLNLTNEYDFVFANPNLINKGLCFSSLSLVSFILGCCLVKKTFVQHKADNYLFPKYIIFIFSFLSFIFFILFIKEAGLSNLISGGGYEILGDITEDTTNRSEYVLRILINTIIIMISINVEKENKNFSVIGYIKQFPLLFTIVFFLYLLLRITSGVRSPVIVMSLLALFSYTYVNHKVLRNYITIILILFGSLFITILGFFRAFTDDNIADRISAGEKIFSQVEYFSVIPFSYELARSVSCNQRAIEIINNKNEPLHYGTFQLRYLATIFFPGNVLKAIMPMDLEDLSSAHFITVKTFGENATTGTGTTFNSDIYLDFGVLGLIFGMLLFGVFIRKVDLLLLTPCINKSYNLFAIVVSIGMSSSVIYQARGMFIPSFRLFVYVFVLLFIMKYITEKRFDC